jgi:hypothetical protein
MSVPSQIVYRIFGELAIIRLSSPVRGSSSASRSPAAPTTTWACWPSTATEAFLDHEFARTRQRHRRKSLEPEQWRPALLGESVWLTEQEYAAAKQELFAVLERYRRDRDLLDPSQQPAGSREARLSWPSRR